MRQHSKPNYGPDPEPIFFLSAQVPTLKQYLLNCRNAKRSKITNNYGKQQHKQLNVNRRRPIHRVSWRWECITLLAFVVFHLQYKFFTRIYIYLARIYAHIGRGVCAWMCISVLLCLIRMHVTQSIFIKNTIVPMHSTYSAARSLQSVINEAKPYF